MRPMITCKTCGRYDEHESLGRCYDCYRREYYELNKARYQARNRAAAKLKAIAKAMEQRERCEILRRAMLQAHPGEDVVWLDWHRATDLYNGEAEELHFRALIRAVRDVGTHYGLTTHTSKAGGGVTVRRTL